MPNVLMHHCPRCTGAGNDQVRFDLIFQVLAPEIEIITPIRDQQLSREAEIEYLQKQGIDLSWEKAQYSINQGLWGTSVGGSETLTSHQSLPDSAYPSQLTENEPKKITLHFKQGELIGLNGKEGNPVELIQALQAMAKNYAIGRDIHVGDTIIGIKGRVGFEAAAPMIILKAHHLLENIPKVNGNSFKRKWPTSMVYATSRRELSRFSNA